MMEYRYLGRTGLRVSELSMGTQTFGWGAEEKQAHRMADSFAEAGGNFFDTSSTYNEGASEEILGSWLHARGNRDSMVIATKVFFPSGEGPNDAGLSRSYILRSVETSLRRLRTDYIDLYQAHCFDRATPIEETLSAFEDLARSGKIRYAGVSNFTASQLMKMLLRSRERSNLIVASLQAEYSLLVRETDWELLPLCEEEGVGLLAWSPLAGGWLTGKYHRDSPPPSDSRVGRGDRWDDQAEQRESERTWRILDELRAIADERGRSPAQVALNYLLRRSEVVVPIFGARTEEQLAANLGAVGWELSEEEVSRLSEASTLPLPYPFRFISRYTRKRDS